MLTAPRPLGQLKSTVLDATSVHVEWAEQAGVKFKIFEKRGDTGKFELTETTTKNEIDIKGLVTGISAKIKVEAITNCGKSTSDALEVMTKGKPSRMLAVRTIVKDCGVLFMYEEPPSDGGS